MRRFGNPTFAIHLFCRLVSGFQHFRPWRKRWPPTTAIHCLAATLWRTPRGEIDEQKHDQLAKWHEQLGFYFELGTLYTMIAGLLNMLVIYDAAAGPVFADPKAPAGTRPQPSADAGKE